MSGLIFLAVLVLWVGIAALIAVFIFRKLPERPWRIAVAIVFFVLLIPLPLIDEIVGKGQFEQLCRENSTIQVARAKAAGKTVYLADTPPEEVKGTWVRIVLQPWRYVDATTNETVVSYNTLQAERKFFLTALVPFTFHAYCAPSGRVDTHQLFKEIGVTQIQRSELRARNKK
jgi:hypothetical protein